MNEKQVKLNEFMKAFEKKNPLLYKFLPLQCRLHYTQWIYDSFWKKKSPLIQISAIAVQVTFMKKHPEASVLSILKLASPLSMHNAACVKHFI